MKRIILALICCAAMSYSCSEDNMGDTELSSSKLIGKWSFSEIEAPNATGNLNLTNQLLSILVASGCDILNYDFKTDQTVTASFRDFSQTGNSVNSAGSGIAVQCPTEVITSTGVWSLEGDKLSFLDANGNEETVTIQIDGDTLTVPGEVINEENLAGTKAIFKKQS